jgi:hypothetical protein
VKRRGKLAAYLAITRQVDFESFRVVFETKRRHGKENVLAVDRLALLLLALFGGCTPRQWLFRSQTGEGSD